MPSNRRSPATYAWALWLGILVLAWVIPLPALAQRIDPEMQTLRAILSKPDAEIDLARVKLTIDRMVDPSIDVEASLQKLDAMAADVRRSAGPNAPSLKTVSILRSYLYDAGNWNSQQPFRYDLDDPLGRKLSNRLLSNYLVTKQGNCLSMPTLYVLLGQRLGLDMTFALAPEHVLVKYRDETGRMRNLEATSGGHEHTDERYQQFLPMTALALKNGTYMRPLGTKESIVAVLLDSLRVHYKHKKNPERILAFADLVLEYSPNDVSAMLSKSAAYALLLDRDFQRKYAAPRDIPVVERPRFDELERNNQKWYEKAEALGWREPDTGAEARYLQMVEKAKSK